LKVNKAKLQATGLLIGVFLAGTIVGGAASAVAERVNRKDDGKRLSYIERLERDLSLSTQQRALAEEFLSQFNEEMHLVWEEVSPRYELIRSNVRKEIMGILDNDQRGLYAAMNQRSDSLRAERKHKAHDKSK